MLLQGGGEPARSPAPCPSCGVPAAQGAPRLVKQGALRVFLVPRDPSQEAWAWHARREGLSRSKSSPPTKLVHD
jgi:hypothetical protein